MHGTGKPLAAAVTLLALSAVAVSTAIAAQATPPGPAEATAAGYVILDLDVFDPEGYEEYTRLAAPTLSRFGGRLLVAGARPTPLEGDWRPQSLAVLAFDSVERAMAWYDSADYLEARALRQRVVRTNLVVVTGATSQPQRPPSGHSPRPRPVRASASGVRADGHPRRWELPDAARIAPPSGGEAERRSTPRLRLACLASAHRSATMVRSTRSCHRLSSPGSGPSSGSPSATDRRKGRNGCRRPRR